MKKIFTLFAVVAMTLGAAANELTVGDSVSYINHIPICGLYADTEGTMAQTIYPASMLADMNGKKITGITFYTVNQYYVSNGYGTSTDESDFINFSGATYQISLLEVSQNDYDVNAPAPVTGATPIATVTPTKGDYVVNIVFDQPYKYYGGNLLVETTLIATVGDWGQTYFLGDGYDLGENVSYSFVDGNHNVAPFIPMTTFTYEDVATAVNDINKATTVKSVKYVNLNGQTSDKPFNGMNIKVSTLSDGTTTTSKVVF
jgi:hypothetical protein